MKKTKPIYIYIPIIFAIFVISGCRHDTGLKKIELDPDLLDPQVNVEDSAVDDLTPIIPIGDGVTVPVYKCTSDKDCNRCKDGDVYGQTCINKTCQGTLDLIEDCKDECSAGECIDKDEFTADETTGAIGEDIDFIDVDEIIEEIGTVANEDLLPDDTQCQNKIEKCLGYRGIGSIYLSKYPECKCQYIYVPAGCNPNDPPCPDFSAKSDYPDCACKK